jgi:hypothetical protein
LLTFVDRYLSDHAITTLQTRPVTGSKRSYRETGDGQLPVTDDLSRAQRLSDGTGEPNAAPNHSKIGADVTRERLAAAIDRLTDRVVIFDPEDRILLGNASWWSEQSRYGLRPKIGDQYRDHIRGIAASGRISEAVDNEEQWISRRLADRAEPDKERKYPGRERTPDVISA